MNRLRLLINGKEVAEATPMAIETAPRFRFHKREGNRWIFNSVIGNKLVVDIAEPSKELMALKPGDPVNIKYDLHPNK